MSWFRIMRRRETEPRSTTCQANFPNSPLVRTNHISPFFTISQANKLAILIIK